MKDKEYLTDEQMAQRSIDKILNEAIHDTQAREDKAKELIRLGITQHLVVQNPKGIDYAVNTIYKLLNPLN